MTIEITKKGITMTLLAVVALLLSAIGGYSVGYSSGHYDGVEETTQKFENPKGTGEHFYAEEITENRGKLSNGFPIIRSHKIYHSTPDCPSIQNGIQRDVAYVDSAYRFNNSTFCPKCMDDRLIRKCEVFLSEDFE